VSHAAGVRAPAVQPETSEAVTWVRANWVTLAAVAMIAAQLYRVGLVLGHAYFRQDDFVLFEWAFKSHLNWNFVGTIYGGHFMPGSLTLAWVLDRISLYDWTLAAGVNLLVLGLACLALLRLLRTLFGNRPALLIPLAVYLCCPIILPGMAFWATTLQWLPTQLAIFMAINAHVCYVRTGRVWHAFVASAWIVFGLLFDEVNALVPFLLLALTSAFLVSGRWPQALASSLRRFWRGWALYLTLTVGYGLVFAFQLHTSGQKPLKPGLFSNVLSLASELLRVSFIPSALGGPWHWVAFGSNGLPADYAFAAEVPLLTQLSWSVAVLIILVSLWYRRHAWRAWVILALWIFGSAVAPLVIGRVGIGEPGSFLGSDLHYLADSLPVLAVCLALAFWPVLGEENAYRAQPAPRLRQIGTAVVLAAFVAGSVWSYASYEKDTSTVAGQSYMATARAAVAAAPKGVTIVDQPVPQIIETFVWFPSYAYTARVLGPLFGPAADAHWTTAPSGVYNNLMIFDSLGRLWSAPVIVGDTVHPPATRNGCWQVGSRTVTIPLGGTLYHWGWEISMNYLGPAATIAVQFGGTWHDVQLPSGMHTVWVPAVGGGSEVTAKLLSGGPSVCVSALSIGNVAPSILSQPTPAKPVSG
jgi:hypothetical protein